MKNSIQLFFSLLVLSTIMANAQDHFKYNVQLNAITIPNLPGLQSFAFGQHDGKWLLIGGRKDGLHARQPFNAFPGTQNNSTLYVVDPQTKQVWTASLSVLSTALSEQLQSTNMNFYQDQDTLVIIGGYAFATSVNDHITFPYITTIQVSGLMQAIENGNSITPYFKQIMDTNFAITGGQLGKIGNEFILVGGQRFDGRYNPMGNPTYVQTYSNQVKKFQLNNTGTQPVVNNYQSTVDAVHLHRRDYNLLPQIFPDGSEGYTISSGVFQNNVDLPYLYPVDIHATGHHPQTGFNQYLSHYHSAKACLYDSTNNEMHSLFFGGLSQYYYQNNTLVQDNNVPFVKTISRLSRYADSSLHEYKVDNEMPAFNGASAEFIPNHNFPHYSNEVLKLSAMPQDTLPIGHIVGGIGSTSLNPFTVNATNNTFAETTIYEVQLIRNEALSSHSIPGKNPYQLNVFPNPFSTEFTLEFELPSSMPVHYFITGTSGNLLQEGELPSVAGKHKDVLQIQQDIPSQNLVLTVVIDNKFTLLQTVFKK
ncbi:MAG TPA: hypothetical protein PLU10_00245 [Chitinophagaceae bacterium]|nr:hypothetical protein [Chitinophagaceae bacterium]